MKPNRRNGFRTDLMEIAITVDSKEGQMALLDISPGGMAIGTNSCLPFGEQTSIDLGAHQGVQIESRYCEKMFPETSKGEYPYKMGIRFKNKDDGLDLFAWAMDLFLEWNLSSAR